MNRVISENLSLLDPKDDYITACKEVDRKWQEAFRMARAEFSEAPFRKLTFWEIVKSIRVIKIKGQIGIYWRYNY